MTLAACVALFVLGAVQGLVGAFFYAGPLPGLAAGFDALIFASCLFGGWGLARPAGAFMPAAGWLLATLALANATSGGSILITDSGAGKLYLFGGAIAAAAGAVTATLIWSGKVTARRRRPTGHRRPEGPAAPVAGEPGRFGGPPASPYDGQSP